MRLFVVVALVLGASSAFAEGSRPSSFQVRSIGYAGSGCPAGTVSTNISADSQAFSLLFDSYVVDNSPGQPLSQTRKNCQITADLVYPAGWSFAIRSVTFRGVARLQAGQAAQISAAYYYAGAGFTSRYSVNVRGPLTAEWEASDALGDTAVTWSPCGANRALNLNTQMRLTSATPRAYGKISVGHLFDWLPDTTPATQLNFIWRRCAR